MAVIGIAAPTQRDAATLRQVAVDLADWLVGCLIRNWQRDKTTISKI